MELGKLIEAVRESLDDNGTPPLYGDEELTRYANNAVSEACLRTRLLQDDSSALCTIATVVDQGRYAVAPEIFAVTAVHVTGRRHPLIRLTAHQLDKVEPGWSHDPRMNAVPKYAVFDLSQKTITVYPKPATAGTLHLRVWRSPTEVELMESEDDEPVVVFPHPELLKHWMLVECYLKKDGELYDEKRAAAHLGLFDTAFGPRPSAHDMTLWSTQPITGPRRMQPDF